MPDMGGLGLECLRGNSRGRNPEEEGRTRHRRFPIGHGILKTRWEQGGSILMGIQTEGKKKKEKKKKAVAENRFLFESTIKVRRFSLLVPSLYNYIHPIRLLLFSPASLSFRFALPSARPPPLSRLHHWLTSCLLPPSSFPPPPPFPPTYTVNPAQTLRAIHLRYCRT